MRQTTLVTEDHAVLPQPTSCASTDCVKSLEPKLKPVTVTEEPADSAALRIVCDRTGASKLNVIESVPARPPTVSCSVALAATDAPHRQLKAVLDNQVAVAQLAELIDAVEVKSYVPKESPLTVTDSTPVEGALTRAKDTAGASQVKRPNTVPIEPATVILVAEIVEVLEVV